MQVFQPTARAEVPVSASIHCYTWEWISGWRSWPQAVLSWCCEEKKKGVLPVSYPSCRFRSIIIVLNHLYIPMGFPGGAVVKNSPANSGDTRDVGSTSGSERCPGERNGNPLQYSCLESAMNRGAWRATVHGVTKNQTHWTRTHYTLYFPVLTGSSLCCSKWAEQIPLVHTPMEMQGRLRAFRIPPQFLLFPVLNPGVLRSIMEMEVGLETAGWAQTRTNSPWKIN